MSKAFSPVALLLLGLLLSSCGGEGGVGGTGSPDSPPIVTTLAATSITPTSAILNGTAIPNGLTTESWFEYGTDSVLATFTSSPKQDMGNGVTSLPANMTWNPLTEGTTYYFRYCAENGKGTSKGLIVSFTTSSPGNPPTVSTLSATSVGATEATLNGNVTPNGLATTAWFEWGTDSSMTTYGSTPTQAIGSGTTSQLFNVPLSGLATGTTYHFRVAASNGSGTRRGSVSTFTPGAAPTATTLSATSVGATEATLNGNVTPNGLATTAWFEWGTDPSMTTYGSTPPQAVGSGTTSQPFNETLSGLDGSATYYFRVVAINGTGDSIGETFSFTTPAPAKLPTATTTTATSITISSADLNGVVNPNGTATDAWFEYGTDPTLSTRKTTASQSVGSGFTALPISVPVSGLTSPYTTWYFRAVASNAGGTRKGAIKSFPTGELFVAVGDSITAGEYDDDPSDGIGFEPILQNLLSAARGYPIAIVNAGVGGVDSAYGAANISTTLSDYPQSKYYLVLYGTNDADIRRPPVSREVYKNNMQAILSAIRDAGKTPYLAKVPYSTNPGSSISSILEYNVVVDELVAENGITVSPPDFYTLFQNPSLLNADGLHPNGKGYRSMADLWSSALP